MLKIAIANDHAGVETKNKIIKYLSSKGYECVNFGCDTTDSCDYPDYAYKVAISVRDKKCDRGILICGTGIGMCITANKVKGVRAAVCWDKQTAELSRKHNDSNILCLGVRVLTEKIIFEIIDVWFNTEFENAGRHINRLKKIEDIENKF
jgi:ribose 5-phosphate isomerase B